MTRLADTRDLDTRFNHALFLIEGTRRSASLGTLADLEALGSSWEALSYRAAAYGMIIDYVDSVDHVVMSRPEED